MIKRENFVNEYIQAITDENAAIFAGAGLSISSGYMDWKGLVKPLAEEIDLDIEKEHDLITIMQYYKNEKGRVRIDESIINGFTDDTTENKNLDIITELPISTYWTTNYDSLLEDSLKKNNKKVDVKINQESLVSNMRNRDAVVYKMHGDKSIPNETVITKDDYDTYGKKRKFFRTTLQSDLINKTFLFIGFSFEDPNLDYILSQIKILLDNHNRPHYCFMKKISENENDFEYRRIKQDLKIKDLKRYNINTVLVSEYSEITDILEEIIQKVYRKNIFISSAIHTATNENWPLDKANELGYKISKALVHENYKVFSGYGKGISSSIITGALEIIYKAKYKHIDEFLTLRPFPINSNKDLWTKYREDMLSEVGIAIFIFGNKNDYNSTKVSDGMIEEFEICVSNGIKVIPIGSTGGAAAKIFNIVKEDIEKFQYLKDYLDLLEDENSVDELIETIMTIIKSLQK